MRLSSLLLLLAVASLLLLQATAFNPYEEEDDSGAGSVPSTSTLSCSKNDAGEEVCESIAKRDVPDEDVLEARVAAAEAEKLAIAEAKAKARAERNARLDAEKAAKRAERQKAADAKKATADQEKKHHDLYEKSTLAEPIKKMKVNYYKFFGVEQDAKKLHIRKVANNLALANHPDKCPDRDDAKCIASRKEKMIIINEAREVLLDDERRDKYDFLLNFGFKVYDEELYKDVKADYDAGLPISGGWGDSEGYDPASDPYESMDLTEESAGWLLLLTGSVTMALLAWPVVKFWEKSLGDEKKKELLKKGLQSSIAKGKMSLESQKKKTEKFTGERVAKRFENGTEASPSPTASASPSASPKFSLNGPKTTLPASSNKAKSGRAAAAVTILALVGLLALVAPVLASAEVSYYDILEVAAGAEGAALKKAYRSAALRWHPDRYVDRVSEQEDASAKFVLIAEAYDVLSDAVKRKEYDTLLEAGYFKHDPRVYAEIMNERNMKWAKQAGFTFTRRGPNGEEPDDTWMLYIAVIFTLISIAVPLYQYMARRARAAAKKKEGAEAFKKNLSAVQNKRDMDERASTGAAEKNATAQSATAERDDDEDEAGAAADQSAEAVAQREERRAAKAAHKKSKIIFRTLVKHVVVAAQSAPATATPPVGGKKNKNASAAPDPAPAPLQAEESDALASFLSQEELEGLVASLWPLLGSGGAVGSVPAPGADAPPSASSAAKAAGLLAAPLQRLRAHQAAEAEREAQRAAERKLAQRRADEAAAASTASSGTSVKNSSEWSPAELSALAKGTAKFPGGINNRWEKITELVCAAGSGRAVKEVLVKSREQDVLAPLKRHDGQAFGTYLDKLGHKLGQQQRAGNGVEEGATVAAATATAAATGDASAVAATRAAPTPVAPAAATVAAVPVAAASKPKPAAPAAAAASTAATTTAESEVDEWSADQQAQLELALRTVSKVAEDRWEQIAAQVTGKSKKQVVQRFKIIKAQLMASKA